MVTAASFLACAIIASQQQTPFRDTPLPNIVPVVFLTPTSQSPLSLSDLEKLQAVGDAPELGGYRLVVESGVRYYFSEELPELKRLSDILQLTRELTSLIQPGRTIYRIGELSSASQKTLGSRLESTIPDIDYSGASGRTLVIDAWAMTSVRWDEKQETFGFEELPSDRANFSNEQRKQFRQQLEANAFPRRKSNRGDFVDLGARVLESAQKPWTNGSVISTLWMPPAKGLSAKVRTLALYESLVRKDEDRVRNEQSKLTSKLFPTFQSFRPGGLPPALKPLLKTALVGRPRNQLEPDVAEQAVNRMSLVAMNFRITLMVEVQDVGSVRFDLTP